MDRFFSISSPLIVTVDKEVKDPVVVQAPWLICEFGKSHHLAVGIKCIGYPDKSSWTNVSLRQSNSRDRNIICNEPLLFGKDGKVKRGAPIFSRNFLY